MMPQACPATVAVPETILVTLSPYGAVPALGTSLLVVSAYLHAQRGGALQRPGMIYPNQQTCNSRSFQYCKWTRYGRYWTSVS